MGAFIALFDTIALVPAFGVAMLLADAARVVVGLDQSSGLLFVAGRAG